MADFSWKIEGLDALKAKLTKARDDLPNAVSAALYTFGADIMTRSEPRVPLDTGFLSSTGHTDLPTILGNEITVMIGYNADYALIVHENLDPHVHWKRPGSGPKYLEGPAREMEHELPGRIAEAVNGLFS
jgi:hypothetical protein